MPKLRVVAGQMSGEEFELGEDLVQIGRRNSNTITIDHAKVSRTHTEIFFRDGEHFVRDMGSVNGTYLNNIRLTRESPLGPGDEIRIGGCVFRYFADEKPVAQIYVPGYKIVEEIAQGGMGTVYRAIQESMDRDVALKVLHAKYANKDEFVTRFVQEARSAGKLSHPNIIGVHDVGKAGGTYYFSMELIKGNDLSQVMALRPFDYPEVMTIGAKVSDALDYAHKNGIIHRDIKPDNIMLADSGEVKLADLGIAKLFDVEGEGPAGAGVSGESRKVLGTPYYMSPEQASGQTIDNRSDLYSLGATLYHILADRPPFEGESNREIMSKHLTDDPPPLTDFNPQLPKATLDVVAMLMEKDKDNRYANAAEAREALEKAAKSKGKPAPAQLRAAVKKKTTKSRQPVPPVAARRPRKKGPGAAAKAGIFGGVLILALIVFSMLSPDKEVEKGPSGPTAEQLVERGKALYEKNDPEGAIRLYRQVLERFPNDPAWQRIVTTRIAEIEDELKQHERRDLLARQWSEYLSWEKEHAGGLEARVERLVALKTEYPELAPRVDARIQDIHKAREAELAKRESEAFTQLKMQATAALINGKFDAAFAGIQAFRNDFPESGHLEETERIQERLEGKLKERFNEAEENAGKYLANEPPNYSLALSAYGNFMEKVRSEAYAERAKEQISRIREQVESHEKKVTEAVRSAIHTTDFAQAIKILDEAALVFQGTDAAERMPKRKKAVALLAENHAKVVKRIQEKGTHQTNLRLRKFFEGGKDVTIMGATMDGLKVPLSGIGGMASTIIHWKEMTPKAVHEIYRRYTPADDAKGQAALKLYEAIFDLGE